jgi:hypothetical protein
LFSCLIAKNTKIKIYKIIILPVVCGYGNGGFTLSKENRHRMLKNRAPRKMFGTKREAVTGVW